MNTSILEGVLSPQRAQAMSARGRGISAAGGQRYTAAALSLVFHPGHPFVPTLRADIRCFQVCSYNADTSRNCDLKMLSVNLVFGLCRWMATRGMVVDVT